MIKTVDDYMKLPLMSDMLPVYSEKYPEIYLGSVTGYCCECQNELTDIRGNVTDFGKCFDVQGGGICIKCNKVTRLRMRWYYLEDRCITYINDSWVEGKTRRHIMSYVISVIRHFWRKVWSL